MYWRVYVYAFLSFPLSLSLSLSALVLSIMHKHTDISTYVVFSVPGSWTPDKLQTLIFGWIVLESATVSLFDHSLGQIRILLCIPTHDRFWDFLILWNFHTSWLFFFSPCSHCNVMCPLWRRSLVGDHGRRMTFTCWKVNCYWVPQSLFALTLHLLLPWLPQNLRGSRKGLMSLH